MSLSDVSTKVKPAMARLRPSIRVLITQPANTPMHGGTLSMLIVDLVRITLQTCLTTENNDSVKILKGLDQCFIKAQPSVSPCKAN